MVASKVLHWALGIAVGSVACALSFASQPSLPFHLTRSGSALLVPALRQPSCLQPRLQHGLVLRTVDVPLSKCEEQTGTLGVRLVNQHA